MRYSAGLTALSLATLLTACNTDNKADSFPVQFCEAPIFYPEIKSKSAFVRFTDDNYPDLAIKDHNNDHVMETLFQAEPGYYNYLVFLSDGSSFMDPFNTRSGYSENYGREVSQLVIPDCHRPKVELTTVIATKNGDLWVEGQWYLSNHETAIDENSLLLSIDDQPVQSIKLNNNGSFSVKISGITKGKHHLQVSGADISGRQAEPRHSVFWVEEQPFSWKDSQIYQIVVDRFADDNGKQLVNDFSISDFHGGTLSGVIKKIRDGYFDSLHVNVLWLSPLYQNPTGHFLGRDGYYNEPYHGYWPIDMRQIDSRFGSESDLHELIAEAHNHGIRVILDSVLNHVHVQNSYFIDHVNDWFNNPEADCICGITCNWGAHYEDCWFDPFLADLSWQKEEQMSALVDDHIYWLKKFDLDGLRMDAVPMMPRMAMRRMRSAINENFDPAGTHVFLLGENYTSRGEQPNIRYYLGPHTLSGLFDFPVMWAIRQSLKRQITLADLNNEILRSEAAWEGSGAIMGMFLGNHDIPRFISEMNDDEIWLPRDIQPQKPTSAYPYHLLEMAWTLLYTLPGAPIIYYGDEIALPGANDPDNRRDMRFEDLDTYQTAMLTHVKQVSKMRASCPVLRRGQRKTLFVSNDQYVFARYQNNELVIVAINLDNKAANLTIDLPSDVIPAVPAVFTDVLTGEKLTLKSQILNLNIDQSAIKVFTLSGTCGD